MSGARETSRSAKAKRRQAAGMTAPEESQRIVLLGGQADRFEQSILLDAQAVVRSPEMEKGLLLQRIEAAGFGGRRSVRQRRASDMLPHYTCSNNSCPDIHRPDAKSRACEAADFYATFGQCELAALWEKLAACSI